ncbi:hypothetical protein [Noviherbaspirillum galbum]|uniref:Uncharacterized protein n=1 Tax=Noviherbaspirillum galbum TaxID=2709383 RepID=A0A6B3SYS4_9BURK|nr:hypothetical protein [Noviherbaspirillum galbum]NEX64002.1 hypothetical protein [Noviherbaspirillum galbum]
MKNVIAIALLVKVFAIVAIIAFSGRFAATTPVQPQAASDIPRITIVAKRLTPAQKAAMLEQDAEQTAGTRNAAEAA